MTNPAYSYEVLLEKGQFSISTVFVYTQLNIKTVLFQMSQFSVSILLVYTMLNIKTVLFQTIPLSIITV